MIKLIPYKFRIKTTPRREVAYRIKQVGTRALAQKNYSFYFGLDNASRNLYTLRINSWDDTFYDVWRRDSTLLSPVKSESLGMVE